MKTNKLPGANPLTELRYGPRGIGWYMVALVDVWIIIRQSILKEKQ
jgi:hypothetical protein